MLDVRGILLKFCLKCYWNLMGFNGTIGRLLHRILVKPDSSICLTARATII